MMKLIVAILALAMLMAPAMGEAVSCLPKPNGVHRFPKTSGSCPTGYFSTGQCCEALRPDTPSATSTLRRPTCPAGMFASGGMCKRFR
jgi:hypothetical protein